VVYFNQSVSGTFVSRTILNATWVIGLWMVALAATAVNRRRSGPCDASVRSTTTSAGRWSGRPRSVSRSGELPHRDRCRRSRDVLASLDWSWRWSTSWWPRVTFRKWSSIRRRGRGHGLSTLPLFIKHVEGLLADGHDGLVGMVTLDIVDFAGVNDTIGYATADELLWIIARRPSIASVTGRFHGLGGDTSPPRLVSPPSQRSKSWHRTWAHHGR